MDRITEFFENSFLKELIFSPTVSDISYNGVDIFYEDKIKGRQKSSISVNSLQINDFLRQIANLSEKQFSYSNPILDVSFSKYRLNAMFNSVVKVGEEKSFSFSIRIASASTSLDKDFFEGNSEKILLDALENKESIVISGSTSSGKTQLQKYLITKLKKNTRVIVIDNVKELELVRNKNDLDLTTWQADDFNKAISFSSLIRNALRNNPDYIIVAESRGAEMVNVLNSVMSGHPIITTLHAKSLESIPERITRMVMMGDEKEVYNDVLNDVFQHFSILVYLKKETLKNGNINRYIESIGRLDAKNQTVQIIYKRSDYETK